MENKELIEFLKTQGFYNIREIPGRGLCGLRMFMFTVGLCEGLNEIGWEGRWCYPKELIRESVVAIELWDGKEDPMGDWIKYKGSREYCNPKIVNMNTTTHKSIDKDAVKKAAENLMSSNGQTTTLEVKEQLRKDNYWCDQREVSDHMRQIASEMNWDFSSNGSHNVYTALKQSLAATVTVTKTTKSTTFDSVSTIIQDLFGIHKYAMSNASRIGKDLGLTSLQIEDLSMECEKKFGKELTDALKDENATLEDIYKYFDNKTKAASTVSGRIKVKLEPTYLFGFPTAQVGATNQEIKDLLAQNLIKEDDWVLSLGGTSTRMIYSGTDSRDHVRTAYARKIKSQIQNTRARRVKTIL